MKVTHAQLNAVLTYINDKGFGQEPKHIEHDLSLDKKTAVKIYRKLELDGHIGAHKTYEDGYCLIYLQEPRGIDFIDNGGYPIEATEDANIQKEEIVPMSIQETCEIIFKEHKNTFSVIWVKGAFGPTYPDKLIDARNKMLHEGILHKTNEKTPVTTIISHEYENADSYNEAKRILTEAKNKPQGHSIVMRDGVAMIQSKVENLDFKQTSTPPTNPTTPDATKPKRTLLSRVWSFISNNVIPFTIATLSAVLAAYIVWRMGWLG
jgi:hypothetical protein